ncbi:MAG TPA: hypothetical protein VL593_16040 [Ramlibacter sp.]|jgi:hypothetical protein|nr:hypothetical protein [Ramlibacter sp.]
MKALYLIAGIATAALLGGCTVYEPATYSYTTPSPRVAYVTPAPTYVAPSYIVVQ